MSLPSASQLEDVYAELLGVAKRCVGEFSEKSEALDEKEIRSIEVLAKVLTNAIDHVSKKPVKNDLAEIATEDLIKEF